MDSRVHEQVILGFVRQEFRDALPVTSSSRGFRQVEDDVTRELQGEIQQLMVSSAEHRTGQKRQVARIFDR
eukprot:750493-Hanusia_phi.AAC.6